MRNWSYPYHILYFDPRGSREPRQRLMIQLEVRLISIHEALASLDEKYTSDIDTLYISIHEALASLDQIWDAQAKQYLFRSTRLSRASTEPAGVPECPGKISIHEALASLDERFWNGCLDLRLFRSTRLSRASTELAGKIFSPRKNFDPRGSREPRRGITNDYESAADFDPRGSREPRRKYSQNSLSNIHYFCTIVQSQKRYFL